MTTSSKRPEQLAWASLVLSIIFFGVCFFLGRWSGYFAVSAAGWLNLAAAFIWLVLAVQFHQRCLAEQERLDMTQLGKEPAGRTIFETEGERATLLAVAQRRLEMVEKWFIPIASVGIAAYELALGSYLFRTIPAGYETTQQPLLCAIVMTGIAFVAFLVSRYATGMSNEPNWRPLRAGGSFLLGIALACFTLAVGLALKHFHISQVVTVVSYVIPASMMVLGAETALNVVLDIYRPRVKGQYSRSAFDSRLLGLFNEPGGLVRSAASAIDYQFGFKVSQTWFYKLLEKAIMPLFLFAMATLYLLSCFVVVNADEEAIIEHFGNPRTDANEVRRAGPGLTIKWPWPIDKVYKYPTHKVMELDIGFVPKKDPETGEIVREKYLLWGKSHYEKEFSVLIASETHGGELEEGAVPVSLINANVPVQYRIKDLYSYLYRHNNPQQLLEAICYRELAQFMASAKVEADEPGTGSAQGQESLLGAGRERAKRLLMERIQRAVDQAGLGVEIIFVGLQGIHPPPEVAPDYESVIGAIQKKKAAILEARAERNKVLSTLAGSVQEASELYALAAQYQQATAENRPADANELAAALDAAFVRAKGEIFSTLAEAHGYAFEKATLAKATGERFANQLKAYRAAKAIFEHEQRLAVLEEALKQIRKFVVVGDPNAVEVFIVDLEEKLTPSLYDIIPQSEESSEQ